jgi:hypothetical protein
MKQLPPSVEFFYSTKVTNGAADREGILFLLDLINIDNQARSQGVSFRLEVFVTSKLSQDEHPDIGIPYHLRRLNTEDISEALGSVEQRKATVCYVCGPPTMTDGLVEFCQGQEGMEASRVLCEKWW